MRRKTREESAVLITYQACMLSTLLMVVDFGLDYLAEAVFVRFLHCNITLLSCLSILYCLKVTQQLKTKEWKVMLPYFEMEHLYKLFRILLCGVFAFSPPAIEFTQSFLLSAWSHSYLFILFFRLSSNINLPMFAAQIVPVLVTGNFQLAPVLL